MKKLVLLFAFLISIQTGYCAAEKVVAQKDMEFSLRVLNRYCLNMAKNFKSEAQFSNTIKNECAIYQMKRQRILPLMFPMTSKNGASYKASYKALMSEYASQMDNEQVEYIKKLAEDYCKYNSYKFEKNNSNACTNYSNIPIGY